MKKEFGAFLCHHKGGGGALVSFVKLAMKRSTNAEVFIDSDNLEDLGVLFDVVRTQVQNHVVILTRGLLKRGWCAGDIVTAVFNKTRIVSVACDVYEFPDDGYLAELESFWSTEQRNSLAVFGVDLAMIREAYVKLRALQMPAAAPFKQ